MNMRVTFNKRSFIIKKNKTPNTNAEKINWKKIAMVGLVLLHVILLIILFVVKAINFVLVLIGVLFGSIKLVSRADDDK